MKTALKTLFGFAAIAVMFYMGGLDFSVLIRAFKEHYIYLLLGFLVYILHTSLAGVRWFYLMKVAGIDISLSHSLKIHMIGLFFLSFFPSAASGDIVKGYYVYKDLPHKRSLALTSIFIDRVIGMYALLFIGVCAIFFNTTYMMKHEVIAINAWFYLTTLAIASLIVAFCFTKKANFIFDSKWTSKLPLNHVFSALLEAVSVYRGKLLPVFLAFLMSLFIHALMIVIFWLSSNAIGMDVDIFLHAFVAPLLLLVNLIPLTPGGIGVGEAASFFLYGLLGVSGGGEIFLLFRMFMYMNSILGAPFYFLYKKTR